MMIKSNTIIAINGTIDLTRWSYFTLAIPCTINKSRPTGVVIKPIERFTTIIKPRNTGSIPTPNATGSSNGVKIVGYSQF